MTFQPPTRTGDAKYRAAFSSYFTDGSMYGTSATLSMELKLEAAAANAPTVEAVADEQWQSFVDYVRDWPGFATSDSNYPNVSPTNFAAGKVYESTEEVTTP
jgi:hypothetical protein